MTLRIVLFLATLHLMISPLTVLLAAEWYVDDSVWGSGNGTSPEMAFKTIAEGVGAASDADVVIVAPGTYLENVDFGGKNIVLRSTHPTDPAAAKTTVIDGKATAPAVTFASTEIEACVLSGFTIRNGLGNNGGGIRGGTAEQHTQATIQNNIIIGNSATNGGGIAYCDGAIRNNLIAGNAAKQNGGGLSSCGGTNQNNTIVDNSATRGGGMYGCSGPTSNCILWGNTASYVGNQVSFCYNFSYCCVAGGVTGEGNISDNPRFIDPDGPDDDPMTFEDNDYRVWVGSQCIDAGKNEEWMAEAADLDRSPRILLGRVSETVDIGAYEFVFNGPTAETWYVDDSVPASGDGKTPETAFKTIQEAIDATSDAGDTVIVAEGGYGENIDLRGRNISLKSTGPTDRTVVESTIIDGSQAGSVVTFAGTEDETCVLSGFTIRNGNGTNGGGVCGGTSAYHSLVTIENNIITGNSAGNGGGLAHCDGLIGNNWVYGNTSTVSGGGMAGCNGVIRNNLVAGNAAKQNGGGLSSCGGTNQNNTIVDNSATRGGGMYGCSGPTSNCILWGNTASYVGNQVSFCYNFSYCCVAGGVTGEGNISDNPRFIDPDGPDDDSQTLEDNDYRPVTDSACVDAGRNEDWMWRAYDLAHIPRILPRTSNWRVDMGAYEYPALNSVMLTAWTEEPQVIWVSEPGLTYVVWSCLDLLLGDWQEEATVSSVGSITSWIDPDTASSRKKFYRIERR